MGFFDFMKKKEKSNIEPSGVPGVTGSGQNHSSEDPFSSSAPNQSAMGQTGYQQSDYDQSMQGSFGQQQSYQDTGQQFGSMGMDQSYEPGYSPFGPDYSQQSPDQQYGTGQNSAPSGREQEIILSKLDAIRTAIQNLDHRLSVIETKLDKNGHGNDNRENIF